jgi:Holliday junction resolvase RusA-like endonuclease
MPPVSAAAPAVFRVRIPGAPVAQGRPRATTRWGNRTGPPRVIDPARSRAWKHLAATLMRAERLSSRFAPLLGPVELRMVAVFGRPKRLGSGGRAWCTARNGDLDNILKAAGDALQAAGVIGDDCQVARIVAERLVAAQGEAPSVVVTVRALEGAPCG